jgi:steroid delta-isomerase-like uncharacterized protein
MPADENKALARRLYEEVFQQGNLDAADALLASDFINHIPVPGAPPLRGTEGIKRFAAAILAAFPDHELLLEDQIAERDRVVSHWTIRGTQTGPLTLPNLPTIPPSGKRFEMTEIRIDRIADGRIAESWFVYDRLGWLQQLGALSSLAAAAQRVQPT